MRTSTKKALEMIQKFKELTMKEMAESNARLQSESTTISAQDVVACSKAMKALDKAYAHLQRQANREDEKGFVMIRCPALMEKK